MIRYKNINDIVITQKEMLNISYLQLKSIKEEKGRVRERIQILRGFLNNGCDEAYGALTELLRDNFDSMVHFDRMQVLKIIEITKKAGCIEPLIDILERFDSIEPKSRYLYQQIGKIIEILGNSKKKLLVHILTRYQEYSSKLIKDAANTAILELSGSIFINRQ